MTRVAVRYRLEERLAGRSREAWARGTVDRAQALELFDALVAEDAASDQPVFGPETGHRLVVLAEPANSAPVNAAAAIELRASVPPVVRGRVPLGLVGGAR